MFLLVLVVSKHDLRFLGAYVTGLVLVLLGIATVNFYVEVAPLPPALQSAWLVIHVFVATLGDRASSRSGSRSRSCSCCRRAASRSRHPRRP